ncbi:MAG: hypothetical protein ABSF52_19195 [Syntrophobacteraceae bacterium]
MGNFWFAHERLEIGAKLDPVGRVHIDHLHLPGQTLIVQQRVHYHQGISQDEPVDPLIPVFIRLKNLVNHRSVRVPKKFQLALLRLAVSF